MTKEITKAIVLQQIQNKFKLRDFKDTKFLFDETVVPTYEISSHLQTWRSARFLRPITELGGHPITAVPYNEKWKLRSYAVVFVSGVFTIAGIYVFRNENSGVGDFSYLDLTAGQNTSYLNTLPEAVTLEPKDILMVNVDGLTSSGSIYLYIDYRRDEIR